ncbi:glycoside hydrolase family 88/105 protein [Marinilabilia salmonicolor]|uniref:glycoside hydrolase family 88/105 protein n=1 Tax=Marinilabilia salmonicolor TaxID=989 RepID=UPI00029AA14A|nr:glycoside hydrolase family 88 protein [Marinilabilia salmonicolor]
MKILIYILAVFGILSSVGCNNEKPAEENGKWSVKMANSVIERHDSLVNYLNPDKIKWQYDIAMVGQAIDKLGHVDSVYSQYMEDYVDYFVTESGDVRKYDPTDYNIDRINPAKNIITVYKRKGDAKYRKAIEMHVEQMRNHPKTKSGGYWHKKIYPWQIWLDGVYMATPFLAQYAREFNAPEWFDEVAHEILLTYQVTHDDETGLLYHAWDESKEQQWADPETGRSPHFWSRAMGWYMMAIVDVLDYFPEDHPKRDSMITVFQNTADALMNVQDEETGLWYQVLDMGDREGNYIEGSGSSMFAYAFAKGARKGYLDKSYLKTANSIFDGILEHLITVDENGLVTMHHICGACGLGGNPYRDGTFEYYISETQVDNDPKGVGPFILAAIELNR